MRIAYVMSRFPRITETFVLSEILAVERALGEPVHLFPLLHEKADVVHHEVEQVMPRTHYNPFIGWGILRALGYYLRYQPRLLIETFVAALMENRANLIAFKGAVGILPKCTAMARQMEREGITHIHAHFATHPALAAWVVHCLTGIPYSFTAHGSDIHTRQTMLATKVRDARFAVMISRYNTRFVIDHCGPELKSKMRLLHCGIDPEYFRPRLERRDASNILRILCVASLRRVKGHIYLLQACRRLLKRQGDFHVDMVGSGPLSEELFAATRELGLEHHVSWHGDQPRDRVAELMKVADVAVLTSIQDAKGRREGIPVVLMEAMASELPVVASDQSGIPELVVNGQTGLLAPPEDDATIADHLIRLSLDPELRQRMGHAGRERVVKLFNIETNAAVLASWFREGLS